MMAFKAAFIPYLRHPSWKVTHRSVGLETGLASTAEGFAADGVVLRRVILGHEARPARPRILEWSDRLRYTERSGFFSATGRGFLRQGS